jgi:hypothetical protein
MIAVRGQNLCSTLPTVFALRRPFAGLVEVIEPIDPVDQRVAPLGVPGDGIAGALERQSRLGAEGLIAYVGSSCPRSAEIVATDSRGQRSWLFLPLLLRPVRIDVTK